MWMWFQNIANGHTFTSTERWALFEGSNAIGMNHLPECTTYNCTYCVVSYAAMKTQQKGTWQNNCHH